MSMKKLHLLVENVVLILLVNMRPVVLLFPMTPTVTLKALSIVPQVVLLTFHLGMNPFLAQESVPGPMFPDSGSGHG